MTRTLNAVLDRLHRGEHLAVSVECEDENYLTWVGVYPMDIRRETTRELLRKWNQPVPTSFVHAYRVRWLKVERDLIERDVSISETEIADRQDDFAIGDDDLVEIVEKYGARVEFLELPYKSEYPI